MKTLFQMRNDHIFSQISQFGGYPGEADHHPAAWRWRKIARCRTDWILQWQGTCRDIGLAGIVFGITVAHHAFDLLKQMRLQLQGDSQHLGHALAGEVVESWPNAARG